MSAIVSFAVSDTGRVRSHNEDSFLVHTFPAEDAGGRECVLAVVADGVGGHVGGKTASGTTVDTLLTAFPRFMNDSVGAALSAAVQEANRVVYERASADSDLQGMATTCTAVAVVGNTAVIAQVGDSRAYLMRNGALSQVTEDHSLVGEMVKKGLLGPDDARHHPQKNIILRAVGSHPRVEPDLYQVPLHVGDRLLMCSDGLSDLVLDEEMADVLRCYPLNEAGQRLVDLANDRGGKDNITVVLLESVQESVFAGDTRPHAALSPKKHAGWRKAALAVVLLAIAALLWGYYFHQCDVGEKQATKNVKEMIKIVK